MSGVLCEAKDQRAGAFTLAELLVVLAVIGILFGLGTAAYQAAKRRHELSATASRIETLLLAARNTALENGGPAWVVADPAEETVTAYAYEVLGEWGFEEATASGTVPLPRGGLVASAAVRRIPGVVGSALDLSRPGAYAECGDSERYSPPFGVRIRAWIRGGFVPHAVPASGGSRLRPARTPAGAPSLAVVERPGSYYLGVTKDGRLVGGIGEVRVRTSNAVLPAERWIPVELRYDGRGLELRAMGITRLSVYRPGEVPALVEPDVEVVSDPTLPRRIPRGRGPLTIGAARNGFDGAVDEVIVRGLHEPRSFRLPPHHHLVGWKKVITFGRGGRLDRLRHRLPVRLVVVELPEDPAALPKIAKEVDFSLTFEEWAARFNMYRSAGPAGRFSLSPGAASPAASLLDEREEEARVEELFAGFPKVAIEVDLQGTIR